jgi:hypothetical protein
LVKDHKLIRPALSYIMSLLGDGVGTDCRYPNNPAPTSWRFQVTDVASSFTPARLTDGIGGIWQNTQFYGCASPWNWLLVPISWGAGTPEGTYDWQFDVAASPGATPNLINPYTIELRNNQGKSVLVHLH